MNDAQKKTPLPVAAEQEGNTSSLATASVPELSQSVKQRKSQKKWTDFHTEKLKNLSLGDFTIQEIADTMGFSRATISRHLQEMKSNDVPVLLPEEKNKLRSLVVIGWSVRQIARKLGRSENAVKKYIPEIEAQLKEKYGAPPLGDVKQREDRERDEKKPAQPEKIVIPVAADFGLLAPGKPLMKTFDALKAMVTYHLCCDIQDCCADRQGVLMTLLNEGETYTLELKKEEP